MKTSRRQNPSVNTGSMADIAFLLLIFFLVATTISAEKGILRQLPPYCDADCLTELHERNVLEVHINVNNEILVENELTAVEEIKEIAKAFIDNNGDSSCNYCNGDNLIISSDNPEEAVISLQHDAQTTYGMFIKVQDELTKAYKELRHTYAEQQFNKALNNLSTEQLKQVKKAYPINISEVPTSRISN